MKERNKSAETHETCGDGRLGRPAERSQAALLAAATNTVLKAGAARRVSN
jgi:hypothetical protein